jgi:cardiolipin synthase A/B
LNGEDAQALQNAGVRVVRFNPVEKVMLIFTAPEVNHRTHRKLLIVDGSLGFIGGVGIADLWLGDKKHQPWRDTMYRITGPVVAQLQGAFMENWVPQTRMLCHGYEHFPPIESEGHVACQVVTSSPKNGHAQMELMYLLAISAAEQSIDIATAYFVPDDLLIQAMLEARLRGVRARIVVPGPNTDQEIVRQASQARWGELLEAGVEIYEFQPSMYHCKFMIVDGFWTSVGSSNLDPRSLRLSDEANLNVYDVEFALQHIEMFESDIAQSTRITELKHERRGLFDRVGEFFASLLGPQL